MQTSSSDHHKRPVVSGRQAWSEVIGYGRGSVSPAVCQLIASLRMQARNVDREGLGGARSRVPRVVGQIHLPTATATLDLVGCLGLAVQRWFRHDLAMMHGRTAFVLVILLAA